MGLENKLSPSLKGFSVQADDYVWLSPLKGHGIWDPSFESPCLIHHE